MFRRTLSHHFVRFRSQRENTLCHVADSVIAFFALEHMLPVVHSIVHQPRRWWGAAEGQNSGDLAGQCVDTVR